MTITIYNASDIRDLIIKWGDLMIIKEFYRIREDGVNLFRNYSDQNVYIKQNQTGVEYSEAIDVENAPYTYTETDKPIDGGTTDTETQQKAEAFDYLIGGDTSE